MFTFALLINKAHTNIAKMRRIKTTPSLTEIVRGMKEGEVAKVHTRDCKETVLRNIVYRLKKEGYSYRVNAEDDYCIVIRLS